MTRRELLSFARFQATQIRNGGLSLILRKFVKGTRFFVVEFPFFILAVPLVLVLRFLKSYRLIRFGKVGGVVIGNSVFDFEYYLSERELERSNNLDLFYFSTDRICNSQWEKMVRRNCYVNSAVRFLDVANQLVPGGGRHTVRLVSPKTGSRDVKGVLYRTEPHTLFTTKEDVRGQEFLRSVGMEDGDHFVCLMVRDPSYKAKHQAWIKSDWAYHNYRDVDIDDFCAGALRAARDGAWVFRMGKSVTKPLLVSHSRVIDYATSVYRSDFLDMWLMANCHYCITTGTGLDDVCVAFRRPLVEVNQLPIGLGRCNQAFTVDLFKYLRWKTSKRFLSLKEVISTGAITFLRSEEYDHLGIEVVDNSPAEIVDAIDEMEGRLAGTWKESTQDAELQERFWCMFKVAAHFKQRFGWIHPHSRISAAFLRANHSWFLA